MGEPRESRAGQWRGQQRRGVGQDVTILWHRGHEVEQSSEVDPSLPGFNSPSLLLFRTCHVPYSPCPEQPEGSCGIIFQSPRL